MLTLVVSLQKIAVMQFTEVYECLSSTHGGLKNKEKCLTLVSSKSVCGHFRTGMCGVLTGINKYRVLKELQNVFFSVKAVVRNVLAFDSVH